MVGAHHLPELYHLAQQEGTPVLGNFTEAGVDGHSPGSVSVPGMQQVPETPVNDGKKTQTVALEGLFIHASSRTS